MVMNNSIFMMVAPPRLLSLPFVPKRWAQVGQATNDFRDYMMSMLNEERRLSDEGKPGTGGLMTSLLRASESHKKSDMDGPKPLSVSEILGNVFVINFAGQDTTANTLAYAIMLLPAHPEIQALIKVQSSETWEYDSLFPRLKRCQAVLLETIRLYPPIMALPKTTHSQSQTLNINGRMVSIHPHSYVVPSLLAFHTHPRYWTPDPLTWRPIRWITCPATESINFSLDQRLEREEIVVPMKGTYFPWSDGSQYCLGKKFAQVEFVALPQSPGTAIA